MVPDLIVYTRRNCHLCDVAKRDATGMLRAAGIELKLREIDVDSDARLVELYGHDVPLFFIGGIEVARHRIAGETFIRAVLAAQRSSKMPASASSLVDEKCGACNGDTPKLSSGEIDSLKKELDSAWRVDNSTFLRREIVTPDFKTSLDLANRIGAIAEAEGHHPDLTVSWGKLGIEISTHAIKGLSRADFVLAAKIDREAA